MLLSAMDERGTDREETRWKVELFGELRVTDGRRVIVSHFRSVQTAGLLGYLALHLGRPEPRDTLAELFWPNDPYRGQNNLRVALTFLRKVLPGQDREGAGPMVSRQAGVCLNPALITTDVLQFERAVREAATFRSSLQREARGGGGADGQDVWWLRARRVRLLAGAVALYRPMLMAGHDWLWLTPEQTRLAELYLEAMVALVDELEEERDLGEAARLAREIVSQDPANETMQCRLIRLYALRGNAVQAERQYRRMQQALQEELQMQPSPAARDLRQQTPVTGAKGADGQPAKLAGSSLRHSAAVRRQPGGARPYHGYGIRWTSARVHSAALSRPLRGAASS